MNKILWALCASSVLAFNQMSAEEEFCCPPSEDFLYLDYEGESSIMDIDPAEVESLVLYQRPNCPYCHKVLVYMEENGINISVKNTLDGNNQDELVSIGGKRQVPCLVINGEALYESGDIIEFLGQYQGSI